MVVGANSFLFSKTMQTGSGDHEAFYSVATGVFFLWVKWLGPKVDTSPPSSAEVKSV